MECIKWLFDHSSRGCIPTYGRLLTATTMVVISAFRDLFSVQRRLADARYDRQILANEIGKGVEDAGCKMERSWCYGDGTWMTRSIGDFHWGSSYLTELTHVNFNKVWKGCVCFGADIFCVCVLFIALVARQEFDTLISSLCNDVHYTLHIINYVLINVCNYDH